jgi:hypothetical protein
VKDDEAKRQPAHLDKPGPITIAGLVICHTAR